MNRSLISRILSDAQSKYGSFESPTYFFVMETYSQQPHAGLLACLSELGCAIRDEGDLNTDVCFTYWIACQNENYILQLSMVGPYGVLLRVSETDGTNLIEPKSQPETKLEGNIRNLVCAAGSHFLGLEELTYPVKMKLYVNDSPEDVRLYHVIFSDMYRFPWDKPLGP